MLCDFTFKNENFATFTFDVEDMKTSKDFLKTLSNFYQNIIILYFAVSNVN